MSLIKIYCVILLFILIKANAQQVNVKDEDNYQQIQRKVERINLKDFPFMRPSLERDDKKLVKISVESREDITSNTHNRHRNWRNSGRSSTNRSLHSRSDFPLESNKSSPLEWTSSSHNFDSDNGSRNTGIRLGLTHSAKPFNFSSDTNSQTNVAKRNCSEQCVPAKYLQHYRAKQCTPIIDYKCNCATSFQCWDRHIGNQTVCQFEGRIYAIGSRIPVQNPCRICECRNFGRRGEILAQIDCGIGIECPETAFGLKPNPNCYFGYRRDQCCGQQICANSLIDERREKICNYRGRQFKVGQKIYPDEDNCKMCLCSHDWDDRNPLTSGSCQTYSCDFQLNKDFQNGCLPIYHEGTCCPIEYKCPKTFTISEEKWDANNCVFDGRKYPLGSRLTTQNVCVECVCKAPPDFTCVHKSCPTPPHNCYVGKWDYSLCCQTHICSRPDTPDSTRDESQFRSNFYSNPIN